MRATRSCGEAAGDATAWSPQCSAIATAKGSFSRAKAWLGTFVVSRLPVVSLGFDFAITPKWFVRQQLDLFYLEYGDFEGSISDFNIALEYLPWKHVGFGLGLDALRVRVEAEGSDYPGVDFKGAVEFDYFGAQLYVKVFL